jgi:thiol-disulfide isomerase/thioredoxin
MLRSVFSVINVVLFFNVSAQLKTGWYRATITRPDSVAIIFNAEAVLENKKTVLYIRNAAERLKVDGIKTKGDSVFIEMPFFESSFKLKRLANHSLKGVWLKGASNRIIEMPVLFEYGNASRFAAGAAADVMINGKWQVTFTRSNGTDRPAIAVFEQKGKNVTGTFLTPSGDYRYLEGTLNKNRLQLSCFDGSHAYYFSAIVNGTNISNGKFYSTVSAPEGWRAVKNNNASLPDTLQRTQLQEGETKLNFRFKDVNGKTVSINDVSFKNKVVIVQLMGSWCPNCMDESRFLSSFYKEYKNKGVEIIAVAYELTTDEARSKASLQKFIRQFSIQYPVLIAPASVNDEQRTEKTLPQLTPIRSFPTTVFIGKDGTVQKVHSGFYGPGTGVYHEEFKKEFFEMVNALLK